MRDFQKHLLKGMTTGLGICLSVGAVWTAVSFAAASWGALPTVNGGSGLTSTAWNDVVSHVNALAGGMNVTGGVVGIGTNTPNVYANHAKLAVNGGISY
ncbi:MAG: hypothetical protein QG650_211 [Patescibacteria group bacterium]|nr:hypothetical protein [Patescibacteria group bacterium]